MGNVVLETQNYKDLWKQILLKLEPKIKKAHFLTWFQDTALLEVKGKTLVVGVPHTFARDWLQARYDKKILKAAQTEKLPEAKATCDCQRNDGQGSVGMVG